MPRELRGLRYERDWHGRGSGTMSVGRRSDHALLASSDWSWSWYGGTGCSGDELGRPHRRTQCRRPRSAVASIDARRRLAPRYARASMAAAACAAQKAQSCPQLAGPEPGGNLPRFRVRNPRNRGLFLRGPGSRFEIGWNVANPTVPFSLTTMMKQKAYSATA
jgi:hypothetical protein